MCGIVGAVASRNITPILVEGLKRLEYRGYDSCGVAVHADGGLKRARSVSRVAELAREVEQTQLEGFTGIAHTRWATHGAPVLTNAHPHFSRDRIALVQRLFTAANNVRNVRSRFVTKRSKFSVAQPLPRVA